MKVLSRTALLASALSLPLLFAGERPAHACGGGFFTETEHTTVTVTDHRMAISVSDTETIIWDQMKYTGSPTEFAFLFPAPANATVETSSDAWFTALDGYTAPTVYSPRIVDRSGCALMGCAGGEKTTAGSQTGNGGASTQSVVGPYLVTRLAPKNADEVTTMLAGAGFFIPEDATAIIGDYISEGQGFVFMRLRPGCGEHAMQPIRIVIPGSHPTVPLRLASLGVNRTVNIELFVLGDRRYAPANYPTAAIDFSELRASEGGSNNYEVLADAAFASGDGRNWITEFAGSPNEPLIDPASRAVPDQNTIANSSVHGLNVRSNAQDLYGSLPDIYAQLCVAPPPAGDGGCTGTMTSMGDASFSDATDPFFDGSTVDASDQSFDADVGDADVGDAGDQDADDAAVMFSPHAPNAGPNGFPNLFPNGATATCGMPTDLGRVLEGIPSEKLYLTRLRAHLPQAAVGAADLELQPSTDGDVSQYHQAIAADGEPAPQSDPSGACKSAPRAKPRADFWAAATALAFVAVAIMRRRRR